MSSTRIRILTDDGAVTLTAEPEDVALRSAHLAVTRDGVEIARFRTWRQWHVLEADTPTTPEQMEK